MTELVKCERCDDHHEPWTHFRRKLPEAKVKKREGFGVFYYANADLCKPCAKHLAQFMRGNAVESVEERDVDG